GRSTNSRSSCTRCRSLAAYARSVRQRHMIIRWVTILYCGCLATMVILMQIFPRLDSYRAATGWVSTIIGAFAAVAAIGTVYTHWSGWVAAVTVAALSIGDGIHRWSAFKNEPLRVHAFSGALLLSYLLWGTVLVIARHAMGVSW